MPGDDLDLSRDGLEGAHRVRAQLGVRHFGVVDRRQKRGDPQRLLPARREGPPRVGDAVPCVAAVLARGAPGAARDDPLLVAGVHRDADRPVEHRDRVGVDPQRRDRRHVSGRIDRANAGVVGDVEDVVAIDGETGRQSETRGRERTVNVSGTHRRTGVRRDRRLARRCAECNGSAYPRRRWCRRCESRSRPAG